MRTKILTGEDKGTTKSNDYLTPTNIANVCGALGLVVMITAQNLTGYIIGTILSVVAIVGFIFEYFEKRRTKEKGYVPIEDDE